MVAFIKLFWILAVFISYTRWLSALYFAEILFEGFACQYLQSIVNINTKKEAAKKLKY